MIYEILNPKIMKLLKHYYTTFITTLFLLFFGHGVWGQQTIGIYESYAILNINSAGNTEYDLNANTGNTDFNNANLGTFLPGTNTLVMAGGINKTYKCNGGDVFGGNINYRVYLTSGSAPSFTSLSMGWLSNDPGGCGGNQTWRINNNTTNIISGLAPGAYTIEVYSDAPGNPSTAYASNNGANYKATFTVATAWNGSAWSNGAPTSTIDAIIDGDLTTSTDLACKDLTINANRILTISSANRLTVNGTLTNNGTLTLESGATLVQGTGNTVAGSGTFNVKQALTGGNDGTIPNGRFWYLGSPVSGASSSVYFASNAANVLKKRNEAGNTWTTITNAAPENLVVGQGYYRRAMGNDTINFTGGLLNNGAITIVGLTRTAGQGFEGFNLVSNPYPSYLDWDQVTKTNVGTTMWYRSYHTTNSAMVFDTYVAGTPGGIGTNLNGTGVSNLIPPMQSFWVRVNSGSSTGSLTVNNGMRSHFTTINGSVAGLKSTSNERKLFIRMNLLQVNKKDELLKDQLIVYVNDQATNGFDIFDGEKMMQAGFPQFYTKTSNKKIVINALNSEKQRQAIPITMELPTTGVHNFIIEDLEISNGLVWLEDKQEEVIQALEPGTVYKFYANSGINSERFVLHFNIIDDTFPINVYNEVENYANYSEKGASVYAQAEGVVIIKLPVSTEGVTDIEIRDATGKLVYAGNTNILETSIQLPQANGIYYVTLKSSAGVHVRKVFIQQ